MHNYIISRNIITYTNIFKATRKRKEPEPPSAEEEQEKEKDREKDREKEEEKRKKNPLVLEMMKSYFNPNPQLRGVPEGPLAQKVYCI